MARRSSDGEGGCFMVPDRVAVLGAGVMGSALAAQLANAGLGVLLLDVPAPAAQALLPEEAAQGLTARHPQVRSRPACLGLKRAIESHPPAFYDPSFARAVELGNFEDDLGRLGECDWVLEAVAENLAIKRALFAKVDAARRPGSLVTTNTSGLSVAALADRCSADFRSHFFGTHFFNPPRYLRLLEIIPGPDSDAEMLIGFAAWADRFLGRGVVFAKDTPAFVANRLGSFAALLTTEVMTRMGLGLDAVDDLTGPLIGRPKTATFGTLDLVGLDIFAHVVETIHARAPADERRDLFRLPKWVEVLLESGRLGRKTGIGLYRRDTDSNGKSTTFVLDPATDRYRPRERAAFPSVEAARGQESLPERLRILLAAKDPAGDFLRATLLPTLAYAGLRIPETCDTVRDVDRAVRWGTGWQMGPFEMWDAVGPKAMAEAFAAAKIPLPPLIEKVLARPEPAFYRMGPAGPSVFDPMEGQHKLIGQRVDLLVLRDRKAALPPVKTSPGASLIDAGDGVLAVEFHSKLNILGPDALGMVLAGVEEANRNFKALVVGNQGEHFSAGANLALLLFEAQEGNWDQIDALIRRFQKATRALRYSKVPAVAAPFGMTLGGGCEMILACTRRRAAAETYAGLVELGAGLVPAGGGCLELWRAHLDGFPAPSDAALFERLQHCFETIALARVSTSAHDARRLGYLREADGITLNPDRLLADAKRAAVAIAANGHFAPRPGPVKVLGDSGRAMLEAGIHQALRSGKASEYDAVLARKLARILTGGDVPGTVEISEERFLELEREAFLSLCGQRRTLERIQSLLKTGKPLRN